MQSICYVEGVFVSKGHSHQSKHVVCKASHLRGWVFESVRGRVESNHPRCSMRRSRSSRRKESSWCSRHHVLPCRSNLGLPKARLACMRTSSAYSLDICSNHKLVIAKAKANYDQCPLSGYTACKAGSSSGSSQNWLRGEPCFRGRTWNHDDTGAK